MFTYRMGIKSRIYAGIMALTLSSGMTQNRTPHPLEEMMGQLSFYVHNAGNKIVISSETGSYEVLFHQYDDDFSSLANSTTVRKLDDEGNFVASYHDSGANGLSYGKDGLFLPRAAFPQYADYTEKEFAQGVAFERDGLAFYAFNPQLETEPVKFAKEYVTGIVQEAYDAMQQQLSRE